MSKPVVISCENVQKTYLLGTEGVPALRGVTLDIYEGEFCVIYGTSGGGKTTLLNILGTIDQPTKGNLAIMGQRLTARTEDSVFSKLRLETLGFVFQTFNLLSTMTAKENVQVPMVLRGKLTAKEQDDRVNSLLESVGMGERMDHYPSMLSGGEQQRVTIARAMANEPKVLLLDEPTGDLDTRNTRIVMDLLLRLNKEHGVTLVMVTHDPEMKWYANRAVYVQDGKIGKLEEIGEEENLKAWTELQQSLQSGGPEPAGLDSCIRREPSVPHVPPSVRATATDPPNTEYRKPSDYTTYCTQSVTQGARSTAFTELFHKMPWQTTSLSGINVEMASMTSPAN
eukprot:TRINITY_DN426_c1_g3_i2.p1 TRINITY_DN426_c1_g3~~TRINITY_DN426_c1_g3_i2.p1  ORF type:complete len:340 (+),score=85.37 TRINITY_DN426_c1_g3_i2:44-1063(+)